MQSSFSYAFLLRLLNFAGELANRPVTKVINGCRRRFSITQCRKEGDLLDLVC